MEMAMTQTRMGWECPRCHRINSPSTPTCFCNPNDPEPAKEAVPPWGDEYRRALEKLKETGWPDTRWPDRHYPRPGDPIWLWVPPRLPDTPAGTGNIARPWMRPTTTC